MKRSRGECLIRRMVSTGHSQGHSFRFKRTWRPCQSKVLRVASARRTGAAEVGPDTDRTWHEQTGKRATKHGHLWHPLATLQSSDDMRHTVCVDRSVNMALPQEQDRPSCTEQEFVNGKCPDHPQRCMTCGTYRPPDVLWVRRVQRRLSASTREMGMDVLLQAARGLPCPPGLRKGKFQVDDRAQCRGLAAHIGVLKPFIH